MGTVIAAGDVYDLRHLDRSILRLAVPAATGNLLRALFTLTDAWWCGQVSPSALAAFGTASFFVWIVAALSWMASVGVVSRVARATGARDRVAAAAAARDGLWVALPLATLVGGLLLAFAPALVSLQGASAEVAVQAAAYLQAIALGAPAYYAHDAADAALRGSGDTRTPALVGAAGVLANFAFDPLLMFGAGPIPALGVAGAGCSTALIQGATALALWTVVRRRGGLAGGRPALAGIRETVRVGAPSAALGAGFSVVYVAITPAVAAFGTAQLAALAIGHRSESFAYMVGTGFGSAAQALVGQGLGAGRPELARAAARRTAWLAALVNGLFSLVLLALAPQVAGLFSADPAVVEAGALYLRIVALSLAPQTVEQVLTGAFEGAGDTLPPLVVGIATHGARLPLVYLAAAGLGLGVSSVWWTISGCSIAAGAVLLALFRVRRWR